MWTIKAFDDLSTKELYAILQARTTVFVVEQQCPYPEVDGKDFASYHVYNEQDGEIVAYARILPAGLSYEQASIGRVLVKKEYRGQGLAQALLVKALAFLHDELHEMTIKIQAQDYLRNFYGSFGFEAVSETYLEDDIPHVDMVKK